MKGKKPTRYVLCMYNGKDFYICTMFMYLIDIFIYYRSIDSACRE